MSDFHSHEPSGGLNLFESVGVDETSVWKMAQLATQIDEAMGMIGSENIEEEFDSKLQSLATDNPPTHIDDCIELAKTAAEQLINEHGDDIDLNSCGNSLHEITSEADWFSKLGFDSDDLDELNLLAYQLDDIFQSLPEEDEQEFLKRLSESHPKFDGYAIAETIKEVAVDFLNEKELGFEIEASQQRKEGILADGYPLENEGDFSSTVSYYEEQQEKQENSQEQPEQG